jgi:hypothetical protein
MSAHTAPAEDSPLLRAILNLSKFHREPSPPPSPFPRILIMLMSVPSRFP